MNGVNQPSIYVVSFTDMMSQDFRDWGISCCHCQNEEMAYTLLT